ncbi:hypothetical protein CAEBREN_08725 [Caenorhabditis brenneri]|uniref:Uncharacterized protein n=1 Tax=Caenorhabditis brenneri TaxID=135651 RepID=G0N9D1_CAEBE|nr:hypothetical protein CAEBREN_08725 [Caenorhabditis brenneri]
MANLPSSSGMLSRLLSNVFSSTMASRCSASGRWWPQPDRLFSTNPDEKTSVKPVEKDSNNVIVTQQGIRLSKSDAAPVYYKPRSMGPGYELVEHKKGEMIANYTLFEAAVNKAKVPWVNYDGLTSDERTIHMAHMKAINDRKLTYRDPKTGYTVFTISHHLQKGKCCGNGCRHCAYEMVNAPEEVKSKKVWNGAFYV